MVAAGRVFSLGYYDHPPASWWLSWGAAHLFGSEAGLAVRLPFIALFALSTWLMYRLGVTVANARAGFWAAVLLNLSPVFGVATGTWVLPDGPLDCALLGATLCLIRALDAGAFRWWFGCGLCTGLALLSKYSAALTIAGAALYLASSPGHRSRLATPKPWCAMFVALLMFAPVFAWNAEHGWASFAFQAGRASGMHVRPLVPLITLAGEALFVLPWIWLPMMIAYVAALRRGPNDWRSWLLCCLAAPPIVVFAAVSGWSSQRVLFHWAAPGYLMLFPLLGDVVARRSGQAPVRWLLGGTAAFVVLGLAVISAQVRFDWLGPTISQIGGRDPDLDAIDWTSLRNQLTDHHVVVGVPNWRDAGKIAYALGPEVTVLCLNRDSRQFGLSWPVTSFIGKDMLIIVPEHEQRAIRILEPAFASLDKLAPAVIRHPGSGRVLATVATLEAQWLRAWPPPG